MPENKGDIGPSVRLSERERSVLNAVVALYLGAGEPVASRQVAEQQGERWSSATIRHVFGQLEASGWLVQPHTSAGRVPTIEALRYYVQHLRLPGAISADDEERLQQALAGAQPGPELLERASRFLSDVSRHIGLVAVAPLADPELRSVRFLRLTDRRVLAVLVAAGTQVRERVVRVPEDYSQEELDAAARFLNGSFAGWKLERIRRELIRRVDEERAAYDRLLQHVLVLYHCGVLAMQDSGQVFWDGASNLVVLLRSHERLAEILKALAAKEKLLALLAGLGEEVAAAGERSVAPDSVRIRVGLEMAELPEFAVVAVPYRTPDHQQGTVAILGPACMEYERAAGAVWRVREIFSQVMKEN